jgi:hypothetical protein
MNAPAIRAAAAALRTQLQTALASKRATGMLRANAMRRARAALQAAGMAQDAAAALADAIDHTEWLRAYVQRQAAFAHAPDSPHAAHVQRHRDLLALRDREEAAALDAACAAPRYACIEAWHACTGSLPYYWEALQRQAAADGAPEDAVYKRERWYTLRDVAPDAPIRDRVRGYFATRGWTLPAALQEAPAGETPAPAQHATLTVSADTSAAAQAQAQVQQAATAPRVNPAAGLLAALDAIEAAKPLLLTLDAQQIAARARLVTIQCRTYPLYYPEDYLLAQVGKLAGALEDCGCRALAPLLEQVNEAVRGYLLHFASPGCYPSACRIAQQ